MTRARTTHCAALKLLGLLALLSATACGGLAFDVWGGDDAPGTPSGVGGGGGGGGSVACVPTTTPETLVLSLSLVPDAGLSQGTCADACVALALADNAQQVAEAASDCSFLPGFVQTERDAGPVLLCGSSDSLLRPGPAIAGNNPPVACLGGADGGEVVGAEGPCNTIAFKLDRNVLADGGNCQDACGSLASQGRFDVGDPQTIVCSVAQALELPIAPVDGGPLVVCDGRNYPTTDLSDGGSCQSACLDIAADGGSFFEAADPGWMPASCSFGTDSQIYSMDAGTYADGGPGVTCTWEIEVPCTE